MGIGLKHLKAVAYEFVVLEIRHMTGTSHKTAAGRMACNIQRNAALQN